MYSTVTKKDVYTKTNRILKHSMPYIVSKLRVNIIQDTTTAFRELIALHYTVGESIGRYQVIVTGVPGILEWTS